MMISPRHHTAMLPEEPVAEWPMELLIDIFYAQTDGWHLEVADRCINGWEIGDGEQCIRAYHLNGQPTFQIPDSGWAVLQMVLNYFETIAFFKNGGPKWKPRKLFMWGVFDVFPEHKGLNPNIAKHLHDRLRSSLYHGNETTGKTRLSHTLESPAIIRNPNTGQVIVDPHRFVPRLRQHLNQYCNELRDESNTTLRENFRKAFFTKYK